MDPKDALLLAVTHAVPKSVCSMAGLKEHPLAPRDAWLACINAGTTDAGYWEWAEDTLSSAWSEVQSTLPPVRPKKAVASSAQMAQIQGLMSGVRPVPLTAEEFERQLKEGDF